MGYISIFMMLAGTLYLYVISKYKSEPNELKKYSYIFGVSMFICAIILWFI
ncbi:hypothetical protein APU01nite_21820 [Alkalibacterium putridalgicola]|uniref:Uncharacterized protein n=1 Tax=Alkalibacterium putridalgicola TaxID=426703 RepID=A0ABQ0V039_9LACT|nr:hypothetical protein APU01nite_21820 [Alkalibacterium putridalgicola]